MFSAASPTTGSPRRANDVNPREQWIMAVIVAGAALYFFELKALYLLAIAGVIYFVLRHRT